MTVFGDGVEQGVIEAFEKPGEHFALFGGHIGAGEHVSGGFVGSDGDHFGLDAPGCEGVFEEEGFTAEAEDLPGGRGGEVDFVGGSGNEVSEGVKVGRGVDDEAFSGGAEGGEEAAQALGGGPGDMEVVQTKDNARNARVSGDAVKGVAEVSKAERVRGRGEAEHGEVALPTRRGWGVFGQVACEVEDEVGEGFAEAAFEGVAQAEAGVAEGVAQAEAGMVEAGEFFGGHEGELLLRRFRFFRLFYI